jgi:hypothetical protein
MQPDESMKGVGMYCPQCGLKQASDRRFCVACGSRLPAELLRRPRPKVTRWFLAVPVHPTDRPGSALRVSRYLDAFEIETPEGSVQVPSGHVRFSIWTDDEAVAAASITDGQAEELAAFLASSVREPVS